MKAILYEAFGVRPVITEVPDPVPSSSGAIVQVEATGICRSDWHGWMGHDPDITLPHVPGHELAGTIVEVGCEISSWQIGDRVTVPFVGGCGSCEECGSGNQQVCPNQFQPGFTAWGSFAEFVHIDFADVNIVALPDDMSFVSAASLGCRFATAFRAVVDQAELRPGDWIAIHGCGGVGLAAIMIAIARGAQVIAIDTKEAALLMAQKLGALHVINASENTRVSDEILSFTNGGAHISIDALGNPAVFRNSIESLRRRGKHVQIGLMPPNESRQPIPTDKVIAFELEILGSHGMQAHRYPALFSLINEAQIAPGELVTKVIRLTDAVDELINLDSRSEPGITVIDGLN